MFRRLGSGTFTPLIVEAQFLFTPDVSFRDAALRTVETARALFGRTAERVARQAFQARGIL